MPQFIIERNIPGASELSRAELREISAKSNDVVAGLGTPYTWVTSYVAGDKVYCVHEADSADTIYRHAKEGGFPADLVTEVTAVIGPQNSPDLTFTGARADFCPGAPQPSGDQRMKSVAPAVFLEWRSGCALDEAFRFLAAQR